MTTPEMTTAELLPCPFCGEVDVSIEQPSYEHPFHRVICGSGCCAEGPARELNEQGAIEAWNRRA